MSHPLLPPIHFPGGSWTTVLPKPNICSSHLVSFLFLSLPNLQVKHATLAPRSRKQGGESQGHYFCPTSAVSMGTRLAYFACSLWRQTALGREHPLLWAETCLSLTQKRHCIFMYPLNKHPLKGDYVLSAGLELKKWVRLCSSSQQPALRLQRCPPTLSGTELGLRTSQVAQR